MKNYPKFIVVLTTMTLSLETLAFDIRTHAAMTSEAIKQSKITGSPNNGNVLKKLGLYSKDDVFKERYIDIGASLTNRAGAKYENDVMEKVRSAITDIPNPYTIPGWIVRGSIREDDNTLETLQGTPQGDEPGGVFSRVYGHFYDPHNDRGLTVAGFEQGAKSPSWATDKSTTANGRKNYYNIPAAREAMWRALTLTELSPNGTLTKITPIGGLVSYAADEAERKAYWATMFRAVGDVVHLLQDAGQPQHTRNDTHSGLGCVPGTGQCAIGHASFFENYLKARTLQDAINRNSNANIHGAFGA